MFLCLWLDHALLYDRHERACPFHPRKEVGKQGWPPWLSPIENGPGAEFSRTQASSLGYWGISLVEPFKAPRSDRELVSLLYPHSISLGPVCHR